MSQLLHLLVVEDSEDDALLLIHELRQGGYDVVYERVDTPIAMSAALGKQTWDLVVSDYSMPHFSAAAALAMLQERGLDLPFIIVSGTIGEEGSRRALARAAASDSGGTGAEPRFGAEGDSGGGRAPGAVAAMRAGTHDFIVKGKLARLVPAIERELRDADERKARRQAELSLAETKRRFQSLIENISGLIAVLDRNGVLLYISPSVERILGHRPDELTGACLAAYLHPDDTSILADLLAEVLRQPHRLTPKEFRIRHRDESWRMLGTMARSYGDDPERQEIVVNAQDITDRKQLEEQLRQSQKMEAIGRLAGGVAHDFNNMLGAITGYSDLLLHRIDSDELARDFLQEIMKAAERATTLTRQLLAFSRKEVVAPQILDLGQVVASVYKMLGRLIGEDIELVTASDPMLARVKADPGQIEQVVMNLAVNARDAMPQGGRLTIETSNMEVDGTDRLKAAGVPPGAYVLLSVSDTGCGMDAETQSHIFEPFFTTKEQGKGTGLGLAMVYGTVQHSGGFLTVESQPGQGSTFRIFLPHTAEAIQPEQAPAALGTSSSGTETVLLVEDEAIVRRLVGQVLRMNGYAVLEATQGEEALRICEEPGQAIDLLLTDVVMPVMSGRELAERAALVRPEMKVLYMSGYTDDAVVRHGAYHAETAFIQKPFTVEALARKVRETLEKDGAARNAPAP